MSINIKVKWHHTKFKSYVFLLKIKTFSVLKFKAENVDNSESKINRLNVSRTRSLSDHKLGYDN